MRTFQFSISSWKNISFNYTKKFTLEDMGYDEEEWVEMSESAQNQAIEDYGSELVWEFVTWNAEEVS